MGTYTTRLGCQLSFSEEKEADIIAIIQKLNATHKTGQFISNLIRIALECPEIIDKGSEEYAPGSLMRSMDSCGISYDRKQFFQSITKDIDSMKQKIDSIYEIAFKTYTLALMGKHLGLEEKSNNNLMASFMLERQLKDIQTKLGVNIIDSVYASNKALDVHNKSQEVLEFIIDVYSGIVAEIASKISIKELEIPVKQLEIPVGQVAISSIPTQPQVVAQPQPIAQPSVQVAEPEKIEEDIKDEIVDFGEEKPIEFGDNQEDLAALANFFGE